MRTCTGCFLLWIRFWIFSIFVPFEYSYSWGHWSVRSHDNSWAMVMVRWPSWRSSLVSAYCLKLELEVCLAKGLIHGCNPLLKIYHVGVLCIALVCSCRARICRFPCFLISSYICSKAITDASYFSYLSISPLSPSPSRSGRISSNGGTSVTNSGATMPMFSVGSMVTYWEPEGWKKLLLIGSRVSFHHFSSAGSTSELKMKTVPSV